MHLGSPRLEVGTTSARLSCDVHHSGEMHTWWIATDHDDIGVIDLGFCALAMYILMPTQPAIAFLPLAVAFIIATLLGFASHAPGSLGVFDAAMFVALPQFDKEPLLATLLAFRLLYFVIPFTLALTTMGTRELWLNVVLPWQERRKAIALDACATNAVRQPVKSRKPTT